VSRLLNKVAFITGAAGGIGLAAAKLFLQEGASVIMADRDADLLEDARASMEELTNAEGSFNIVKTDVTSQQEIEQTVSHIQRKFNRIDIAVLNAGIPGANMPLEDYPVELFDQVMAVNMRGVWLGMRAVIPLMKQQQGGSIIMTSSIQGLSALPGTTAYTTSKHALVGMMKGAALELAEFGIRVNAIHPGYVETPMMEAIHHAVVPDAPEKFQASIASSVPMGRYAKADEIARMILFLASDESSYSTGSSFLADGGILAALPTV
jgi:NAD(P)-dependent dehydrogenase (short-subunit alcohol dehydrogenase family)